MRIPYWSGRLRARSAPATPRRRSASLHVSAGIPAAACRPSDAHSLSAPVVLVGVLALAGCTATPPAPTPTAPQTTAAATRPTIGSWHALVYHARLGMSVLVNGGPEGAGVAEAPLELWGWNGRTWRQLSGAGPLKVR